MSGNHKVMDPGNQRLSSFAWIELRLSFDGPLMRINSLVGPVHEQLVYAVSMKKEIGGWASTSRNLFAVPFSALTGIQITSFSLLEEPIQRHYSPPWYLEADFRLAYSVRLLKMLINVLSLLFGELVYLSTHSALNILVLRVDGFTVLRFHRLETFLLLLHMIQVWRLHTLLVLKSLPVRSLVFAHLFSRSFRCYGSMRTRLLLRDMTVNLFFSRDLIKDGKHLLVVDDWW